WGANQITYIQVDASTIPGTITGATLSATLKQPDAKRARVWGVGYNSSTWSSSLTWNTADKSITTVGSTVTTKKSTADVSATFDITDALKTDDDKIVTLLVYQTAAGGGSIANPTVTVTYTTAQTAAYTVKYVCNSTEIKTAETRTGIVNQAPELESSDKDDIKVTTDGVLSAKYIYSSDDAASQTIASDGSTVITVNFREASKYTYTINAVGGSKTVQLASGSNFEGETLSVAYPRYLLDGTDLYKKEPISNDYHQTYTLTGNLEENLTYTKDLSNVVYYKEAEDIEGMTTANGSSANIRCSMGVGGFNGGDTEVALATLPAGSYSMIASTRGSGDGSLPINIAGTKWDVQTHGYNVTETKAFTLSEEGAVTVPTGGNNKNMFDFFVIQKIATPSATITSAKYATYVAQGNVTIPSGVTAYTVKLDGESLTYTALDASTVIPEGTALLLYGEAKTYEFPYTLATASTITDNSLKASTGEGVTADGTQYILANVDGTLGFYQATTGTTIAAGKAYLEVSAETAKAVKCFEIGTTTGISNVSTTTADKGAYYNLQGMKVVRPAKGIFIHNGKKMVIK
ncbi:MAG: hypothetical protein PUF63_09665, partial [Prevotella sp.]|nr:hypothetical protein [Prevotella sp.]